MKSRGWVRLVLLALLLAAATGGVRAQQPAEDAGQQTAAQAEGQQAEPGPEQAQEEQKREEVTTYTLPPEKYEKAVAYARAANWLYFISVAWGVVVVLVILRWRVPPKFRDWAERSFSNRFLQAVVFVPLLLVTLDILDLPTTLYGHWLSLKYEQSVQGWASWSWDWTKGEIISLIIGIPLIWLFYLVVRKSPKRWWLYFWLALIPILVFLMWVVPVVVTPLFYEFEPLAETQPALVEEIQKVVGRTDLEIPPERMFEMKASEKLKSVNAYVTGFGATKRVVVWDTTIEKMTPEQTLFVFGHEMGHYVLNHIYWGLGMAIVGALVLLFLGYHGIHWATRRWGSRWAIRGVDDWASFPAFLLIVSVLAFLSSPISAGFSRGMEHDADIYGLEVIRGIVPEANQVAAEAFQILGEINLADPEPSDFIKYWRYSHPPLKERVEFANQYDPWSKGEEPKFVK